MFQIGSNKDWDFFDKVVKKELVPENEETKRKQKIKDLVDEWQKKRLLNQKKRDLKHICTTGCIKHIELLDENLKLYVCDNGGNYHVCQSDANASCKIRYTNTDGSHCCIFSGIVIGSEIVATRSGKAKFGGIDEGQEDEEDHNVDSYLGSETTKKPKKGSSKKKIPFKMRGEKDHNPFFIKQRSLEQFYRDIKIPKFLNLIKERYRERLKNSLKEQKEEYLKSEENTMGEQDLEEFELKTIQMKDVIPILEGIPIIDIPLFNVNASFSKKKHVAKQCDTIINPIRKIIFDLLFNDQKKKQINLLNQNNLQKIAMEKTTQYYKQSFAEGMIPLIPKIDSIYKHEIEKIKMLPFTKNNQKMSDFLIMVLLDMWFLIISTENYQDSSAKYDISKHTIAMLYILKTGYIVDLPIENDKSSEKLVVYQKIAFLEDNLPNKRHICYFNASPFDSSSNLSYLNFNKKKTKDMLMNQKILILVKITFIMQSIQSKIHKKKNNIFLKLENVLIFTLKNF